MIANGTIVGNLDMNDGRDRGLLRVMVGNHLRGKRRWPGVTDELKSEYLTALNNALRIAKEKGDQRGITSCVDTLVRIEQSNQADELAILRAECGEKTEVNVNVSREIIVEFDRGG